MPRNVTVTFDDGSTHVYQGVPDSATPDQVEARAAKDFAGKRVKALDGGANAAPPPAAAAPSATEGDVNDRTSGARKAYNQKLLDPNSKEFKDYFAAAKQSGYGGSAAEFYQQTRDDVAQEEADTASGNYGLKKLAKGVAMVPVNIADAALSLGSSVVSTPVAGVAGTVVAPAGFVRGHEGAGARVVEGVQNAMTYQPRSKGGKVLTELVAAPFQALAKGADIAGEATRNATGSPLAATVVNTTIQALPALFLRGRGKAPAGAAEGDAAAAAASAAEASKLGASPEAVGRAKKYAADRMGANWEALSEQTRSQIAKIAEDAANLDKLDPAAVAREAKFQSLPVPVPATRGTLERDPVAMRQEANAAGTKAGQPIYDINLAANQALLENLDVLRGKVSGTGKTAATATTAEQTGASVQGAARAKLEWRKKQVDALYKKADEAGETLQIVPDEKLIGIFDVVGETLDQPHFSYAKSWLQQNAKLIDSGKMDIRGLERLRKQAVAKVLNGGEDAHYAGQLIGAIDKATEGAGGKLFQEARSSRRAQAMEFEEQGAVADLVGNASRTDRVTALENTTRTIMNGSLEDVRKIKRTLLTGGEEATRTAGKQAWRDVRRQVIEDIKNESTKGVAPNKDGTANLSPAALKKVIDRYGPDKLDEIFGPGTRKELDHILEVARDAKTQPPRMDVGSSTLANILNFLGKGLDKIPVVGGPAVDIVRGAAAVKNIGADARAAQKATVTPLNEALKKATDKAKRDQKVGTFDKRDTTLIPLSEVGQQQRKQK